jgi:DTW domain-containing protein YfiP
MHHREKHLTSNTAKLAQLTLENAIIHERGLPEKPFLIEQLDISKNEKPIYLFPDTDAVALDREFISKNTGPFHLIVPDGTWNQAKKVRRRVSGLGEIQCVKLPDDITGEYQLRKGVRSDGVCTFEAIAYALKILEGEDLFEDLIRIFRIMNSRVAKSRSAFEN